MMPSLRKTMFCHLCRPVAVGTAQPIADHPPGQEMLGDSYGKNLLCADRKRSMMSIRYVHRVTLR